MGIRGSSPVGARAPHCSGLSRCGAQALGVVGSSTGAQLARGVRSLRGPGTETTSPALAGRLVTTEPAGSLPSSGPLLSEPLQKPVAFIGGWCRPRVRETARAQSRPLEKGKAVCFAVASTQSTVHSSKYLPARLPVHPSIQHLPARLPIHPSIHHSIQRFIYAF